MSNVDAYYNTASLDNKQKMLGLMFPEKLVFSNNTFQTIKPSELLTLLCTAGKDFAGIEKGLSKNKLGKSCVVTPKIQFSNLLWYDFKRIYELKALMPVVMLQPNRGQLYKSYVM